MAGINSAILHNVGLKIREKRIEYDITQSELANAIGSNKSKISNIETGQTIPSIETLVKIGDAMESIPSIPRRNNNTKLPWQQTPWESF